MTLLGVTPSARAVALGVLLSVPLYGGLRTARDYFQVWAVHPETEIAFDADIRDFAEWVVDRDGGRRPRIPFTGYV